MKSVFALPLLALISLAILLPSEMALAKAPKKPLPAKVIAPTPVQDQGPAYLVLDAPQTYVAPQISLNQWWTQLSLQAYRPSGTFNGPQGASQNFSQAGSTVLPRLDLGLSRDIDPDWTGRVSVGAAWTRQNLAVSGSVGNVDTQLTSFLWSARPGIGYKAGRWLATGVFEFGEIQLIQDSSSVKNSERRKATLVGAGLELARPLNSSWTFTGSLFNHKSSQEDNAGVSPVALEIGVRTQW